jgi:hypothetical protein
MILVIIKLLILLKNRKHFSIKNIKLIIIKKIQASTVRCNEEGDQQNRCNDKNQKDSTEAPPSR